MDAKTIAAVFEQVSNQVDSHQTGNLCEDLQSLLAMLLRRGYTQVRGQAAPSVMRTLLELEIEIGGEDGDFKSFEPCQMVDLFDRGGVVGRLQQQLGHEDILISTLDPKTIQRWLDGYNAAQTVPAAREVRFVLAWMALLAEAIGIAVPDRMPAGKVSAPAPGHLSTSTMRKAAPDAPVEGNPYVEPHTGIAFVHLSGGTFAMGDLFDDGVEDEKPVHEVELSGFFIAETPVTQAQWRRLMPENPSAFNGDDHPVEQATLPDVMAFIERLNQHAPPGMHFDLPTEAQWEYAARSGGEKQLYAGGDDPERVAWFEANSPGHTAPVATLTPNGSGLFDMSGNVWEWCRDVYLPDAYRHHERQDPVCLRGGTDRVIRGGSWHLDAWSARCARRFRFDPELFGPALGFRVVMVKGG